MSRALARARTRGIRTWCALALMGCGRDVVLGGGAPVDATVQADAAVAQCAAPGAGFCDSFETELPGAWQELQITGTGELDRVTEPSFAGDHALRVRVPAGGAAARTYLPLARSVTRGTINARLRLYWPSQLLNSYVVLLDLRQSANVAGHKVSVDIIPDGRLQLATTTEGMAQRSAPGTLPADRWVCVELRVDVADAGGLAEVWVDGARLLVRGDADTLPEGGIDRLAVGADSQPSNPAVELYLDDVVLSEQPIGCD